MKRIIKIIATFITLIIVNYNMCFADVISGPTISVDENLLVLISLTLPLIFILGIILIVIELVTYIYKKKKQKKQIK